MADPESPEQLPSRLPNIDALQFRRAQPIISTDPQAERSCAACKQLISGEYYQVQNHVICASCAEKIRAGQQSPKAVPLLRPILYGIGAAVAGSILYAIPLAMGFQIGIVALLVGWMVGKAIRNGSYGVGGRPQQILALALTYFAISTSFLPAALFIGVKQGIEKQSVAQKQSAPPVVHDQVTTTRRSISTGQAVAGILVLTVISPFLELKASPVGGLISLFILFIGLQRAWVLTARHEIIVTGPYS